MGAFANRRWLTTIMVAVAAVIISLNGVMLATRFFG
jgi:hypothetical protein